MLDLVALELKGGEGVERRRPIGFAEIDNSSGFNFGQPGLDLEAEAEGPVAGRKFGNKGEAFFGAIGMTVQRNGRGVAFRGAGVFPKASQFVLQGQPPLGSE